MSSNRTNNKLSKRGRRGQKHQNAALAVRNGGNNSLRPTLEEVSRVNQIGQISRSIETESLTRVVQQYLAETTIAQTNGAVTFFSGVGLGIFSPSLSLLDQAATFTALYDQYKILRIDWEFRPMFGQNVFSVANDIPPLIYTVLDYDDNASLGTLAQARQYENMKIHQYEKFDVTCAPCTAITTATGGQEVAPAPWINCTTATVVHFGCKGAITAATTADLQRWWVSTRLTVAFRALR